VILAVTVTDGFRVLGMALAVAVGAMVLRLWLYRIHELLAHTHDDSWSLFAIDSALLIASCQSFILLADHIGEPPAIYGVILSIPWLTCAALGLHARRNLIRTRRMRRRDDG
jgi:hypothetical protein